MTRRTWTDLQTEDEEAKAAAARLNLEIDRDIYAMLSTPEGKRGLARMRFLTIENRNRPDETDGALRWSEAQRNFVAILEARAERHSQRVAKPPEAKSDVGPGEQPKPRRRRRRSPAP